MPTQVTDLSGQTFGRLYVVRRAEDLIQPNGRRKIRYLCRCSCPEHKEIIVQAGHLKDGHVQSCGCLNRELSAKRLADRDRARAKHGKYESEIYKSYRSMIERCEGDYDRHITYYRDKGIRVCPEWASDPKKGTNVESFRNFYNWAMANGWEEGKTLDRIDGTKGYYPENCRWATPFEQSNNISSNRYIELFGQNMTVGQAARTFGINYNSLQTYLYRNNYDSNALVSYVQTPYGPIQTLGMHNQPATINAIYFLDEYGRPVNQNEYTGPRMTPVLWYYDDKGFFTKPVLD